MYRCLSPLTPKILVFSLIVFFNVFEKKLIMLYFENLGTTYNPSIFKWLARGLGPPSAGHNSRQCYGNIAGAL